VRFGKDRKGKTPPEAKNARRERGPPESPIPGRKDRIFPFWGGNSPPEKKWIKNLSEREGFWEGL